ncbi:MAG: YceI family protein [Chitinophagales bacterium]|nr:YceI family protein [Chitinophagales bacterium]
MQKQISLFLTAIAATALLSFTAYHTENFSVDVNASSVKWLGKKVTGQHEGNVKLKSGTLVMNHGTPVSGSFELDMTSITCTDITDPKKNQDLVGHLKNDDFFSVDKFPVATLTVSRITAIQNPKAGDSNYELWGNLTIKGITQQVQFPARFEATHASVKASAKITIDRTKWNISYKSGTVFPELVDKAIADNIEFEVSITAIGGH